MLAAGLFDIGLIGPLQQHSDLQPVFGTGGGVFSTEIGIANSGQSHADGERGHLDNRMQTGVCYPSSVDSDWHVSASDLQLLATARFATDLVYGPQLPDWAEVDDNFAAEPLAGVRLEIANLAGQVVTQVQPGEEFLLRFYAHDLRSVFERAGIFAAYTDILFDSTRVTPVTSAPIQFGPDFGSIVSSGSFGTGIIDELGAVSDILAGTNVSEALIATVRMQATGTGIATFISEPADIIGNDILLFGMYIATESDLVTFGRVDLLIGDRFTAVNDSFSVVGNSVPISFNVLANDTFVDDRSGFVMDLANNDEISSGSPRSGFGIACRNYAPKLLALGPDFTGPRNHFGLFSPFDSQLRSEVIWCFEVSNGYQAWTDIAVQDIVAAPDSFGNSQQGLLSLQLRDVSGSIIGESSRSSIFANIQSNPQFPLQAGDYFLHVLNHAPNNSISYKLVQNGVVGQVEDTPDRYEPNDTRLTATDLQTISGALLVADLSIHTTADRDLLRSSGVLVNDGDDENDNVRNTGFRTYPKTD